MNMFRKRLCVLSMLAVLPLAAARADAPDAAPPMLEPTLVTGSQPGPGLWRVEQGEHVLWLFGAHSPLPRRMQWEAGEVEAVIADAGVVITEARVTLDADVGRLRALTLMPAALAARRLPERQRLVDVLPAELHARWTPLKHRYIGRAGNVERWRPLFAADRLFVRALEAVGLERRPGLVTRIEEVARRHKVEIVHPKVELKLEDPRGLLKAFSRAELDDTDCMRRTVERLETDLDAMRQRANAWAIGDVAALRELPHPDNDGACVDAIIDSEIAERAGVTDLRRRARDVWLEAVDTALQQHRVSLAVVSIDALLREDGVLAQLQARGYRVVEPE